MALSLLVQFVFRLAFGLAVSMLVTPSSLVTSGFFRVHLWVVMGLGTLAAMAAFLAGHSELPSENTMQNYILIAAIVTAVASYVGAAFWLYENAWLGKFALAVVVLASCGGAMCTTDWHRYAEPAASALAAGDALSSGLLLGVTMAAMLLGHWYLNTPTMELLPLQRLVILMVIAVLLRALLSGAGLSMELSLVGSLSTTNWLFVVMRWLSGILATLLLGAMTWQTLKIPNTQSATGILYVAVICSFLGELTSQLLSVQTSYPL